MDTIINWLNGLSRKAKIALLVAVAIFTPAVGILFAVAFSAIGAVFTVLGFVLGFVNWGVATLLILGFGGYKAYRWAQVKSDEMEEIHSNSWDPFR